MQAQHLSDGSLVMTGGAHPKGIGQWLHLTFKSSRQIKSARLAVIGATAKGHMMKANPSQGADSSMTQDVTVLFSAGSGGTSLADVWVPEITAVESIELRSAIYSDGSVWQASGAACQVRPDPFMLVTSR